MLLFSVQTCHRLVIDGVTITLESPPLPGSDETTGLRFCHVSTM